MTVTLENNLRCSIQFPNGMYDLLDRWSCGRLAGFAPGRSDTSVVHLFDDPYLFQVRTAADCRLFARLLRIELDATRIRNAAFERENKRKPVSEDRTLDEHTVLPEDDLRFYEGVARFFARSKWVAIDFAEEDLRRTRAKGCARRAARRAAKASQKAPQGPRPKALKTKGLRT